MKKELSPLPMGISEGLRGAVAHAKGNRDKGTVEDLVMVPDVKAIRDSLGMSQHEFAIASAFRLPRYEGGNRAVAVLIQPLSHI